MKQMEIANRVFCPEKFKFLRADAIIRDNDLVPESGGGVYALFVRGGQRVLQASGYFEMGGQKPASIDGFVQVYIGSTYEPRRRLKEHLEGEIGSSTLRKTLFAIDACCSQPRRLMQGCGNAWNEDTLTDWLVANTVIAIRPSGNPHALEKNLLSRTASPLNITQRRSNQYARRLTALRCMFDGKPIPRCCADAARQWLQ